RPVRSTARAASRSAGRTAAPPTTRTPRRAGSAGTARDRAGGTGRSRSDPTTPLGHGGRRGPTGWGGSGCVRTDVRGGERTGVRGGTELDRADVLEAQSRLAVEVGGHLREDTDRRVDARTRGGRPEQVVRVPGQTRVHDPAPGRRHVPVGDAEV